MVLIDQFPIVWEVHFAILTALTEFSFMWSQVDLTGEVYIDCIELEGEKKVRRWIRRSGMKTGANVRI